MRDWWYDVYPNLMFYAVAIFYPNEKTIQIFKRSAAGNSTKPIQQWLVITSIRFLIIQH
jgi:hypothetical protein